MILAWPISKCGLNATGSFFYVFGDYEAKRFCTCVHVCGSFFTLQTRAIFTLVLYGFIICWINVINQAKNCHKNSLLLLFISFIFFSAVFFFFHLYCSLAVFNEKKFYFCESHFFEQITKFFRQSIKPTANSCLLI